MNSRRSGLNASQDNTLAPATAESRVSVSNTHVRSISSSAAGQTRLATDPAKAGSVSPNGRSRASHQPSLLSEGHKGWSSAGVPGGRMHTTRRGRVCSPAAGAVASSMRPKTASTSLRHWGYSGERARMPTSRTLSPAVLGSRGGRAMRFSRSSKGAKIWSNWSGARRVSQSTCARSWRCSAGNRSGHWRYWSFSAAPKVAGRRRMSSAGGCNSSRMEFREPGARRLTTLEAHPGRDRWRDVDLPHGALHHQWLPGGWSQHHGPGQAAGLGIRPVVEEPVRARSVGVAAKLVHDDERRAVLQRRRGLDELPRPVTEPVGAPDAAQVKRVGAGVGYFHVGEIDHQHGRRDAAQHFAGDQKSQFVAGRRRVGTMDESGESGEKGGGGPFTERTA